MGGSPGQQRAERESPALGRAMSAGPERQHRRDLLVAPVGLVHHRVPEAELLGRHDQVLDGATEAQVQLPAVPIGHPVPPGEIRANLDPLTVHPETPRLSIPGGRREGRVADQEAQLLLDGIRAGKFLNRRLAKPAGHGRLPLPP